MQFSHSGAIWSAFPDLAVGVIHVECIRASADAERSIERFYSVARTRLARGSESDLPEIQAWRRAFARMGLKPTQYRCASEALLRRFRQEGSLPRIHPMVDLCNAVSLAFAIPVAVIDVSKVRGFLEVRHATGAEEYQTFSGATEKPEPGEVIFADDAGQAHARRWTNRQSGLSAMRDDTRSALIVAEAMHATASDDVARLVDTIAGELRDPLSLAPRTAQLSKDMPRFNF